MSSRVTGFDRVLSRNGFAVTEFQSTIFEADKRDYEQGPKRSARLGHGVVQGAIDLIPDIASSEDDLSQPDKPKAYL